MSQDWRLQGSTDYPDALACLYPVSDDSGCNIPYLQANAVPFGRNLGGFLQEWPPVRLRCASENFRNAIIVAENADAFVDLVGLVTGVAGPAWRRPRFSQRLPCSNAALPFWQVRTPAACQAGSPWRRSGLPAATTPHGSRPRSCQVVSVLWKELGSAPVPLGYDHLTRGYTTPQGHALATRGSRR
jgi:hypothetical protein